MSARDLGMVSETRDVVVIVGPQGCGKSTHARFLANAYGCSSIVDDAAPDDLGGLEPGTLILTNYDIEFFPDAIPFDEAMNEARARAKRAAPSCSLATRPANDEMLKHLQLRNEQKRAEAINWLGDRWVMHPSRRIR